MYIEKGPKCEEGLVVEQEIMAMRERLRNNSEVASERANVGT
jgi:hypothetical protein